MPTGTTTPATLRQVAPAGLAYVVLAGLENIDFQQAPAFGASATDIAGYYADDPGARFLSAALGAISLAFFVVFALRLRAASTSADPSRAAGRVDRVAQAMMLGGAVAGPALAVVSLGVKVWLAAGAGSMPASSVLAAHGLYLGFRAAGAVCTGVFLAGVALRGGADVLPRPFRLAAWTIGGWLVVTNVLTAVPSPPSYWWVFGGLVAASGWTAVVAGYALLAPTPPAAWPPWPVTVARILFGLVALAAGISGLALSVFPGSTGSYFAWPVGPPALAALLGGCYLAAAAGYAAGLARGGPERRWAEAEGLLQAIVVLSVPVLVTTLAHIGVFDLGWWQAWAWVVLFGAFPVAATVSALAGRRAGDRGAAAPAGWVRVLLLAYVVVAVSVAVMLWTGRTSHIPVTMAPFGAQVLGCWFGFAGFLAAWAALRPEAHSHARPVALVLVALPAAWLLASARGLPGWEGGADGVWWLAMLGFMLAAATAAWRAEGDAFARPARSSTAGEATALDRRQH